MNKIIHNELFKDINQHWSIFLLNIEESIENSNLIIYIAEGMISDVETDLIIGEINIGGRDVEVTNDSAIYRVEFDDYIAYSVLNESYTVWDEYGEWEGHKFRVYAKSYFLEYIQKDTIASNDYPGPYVHYMILTEDHILNVVSCSPPIIKRINDTILEENS